VDADSAPVVLERGLVTERSPGGREIALSIEVDADTGVSIRRGVARGMRNHREDPPQNGRNRRSEV